MKLERTDSFLVDQIGIRTCVGCGLRLPKNSLVRLAISDENFNSGVATVLVDTNRHLPGRGVWVHPEKYCFIKMLKRNNFARWFRNSKRLDLEQLLHFQSTLDSQ